MNCRDAEKFLSDYIDGTLDDKRKKMFEEHLRECAACKNELLSIRAVIAQLDEAIKMKAPGNFLEKVHERIKKPQAKKAFLNFRFGWELVGIAGSLLLIFLVKDKLSENSGHLNFEKMHNPVVISENKSADKPQVLNDELPGNEADGSKGGLQGAKPQRRQIDAPAEGEPSQSVQDHEHLQSETKNEKRYKYDTPVLPCVNGAADAAVKRALRTGQKDALQSVPGLVEKQELADDYDFKETVLPNDKLKSISATKEAGFSVKEQPKPGNFSNKDTENQIRQAVKDVKGRILSIKINKATQETESMIIEISIEKEAQFSQKLSTISGIISKKHEKPASNTGAVNITINLAASK